MCNRKKNQQVAVAVAIIAIVSSLALIWRAHRAAQLDLPDALLYLKASLYRDQPLDPEHFGYVVEIQNTADRPATIEASRLFFEGYLELYTHGQRVQYRDNEYYTASSTAIIFQDRFIIEPGKRISWRLRGRELVRANGVSLNHREYAESLAYAKFERLTLVPSKNHHYAVGNLELEARE